MLPGQLRQRRVQQALIIGLAQIWVADQATDALALATEFLQQPAVFGAVRLFELQANPLRQRWAVPTGGDGHLQGAPPHDRRRDKVTGLWCVDDIDPHVVGSCRLAHGHVDLVPIGRANDQRTAKHIAGAKGTRLMDDQALAYQGGHGCAQCRAHHGDARLGIEQSLRFPCGNLPTANDQAALAL
jgi:hypothetical protein